MISARLPVIVNAMALPPIVTPSKLPAESDPLLPSGSARVTVISLAPASTSETLIPLKCVAVFSGTEMAPFPGAANVTTGGSLTGVTSTVAVAMLLCELAVAPSSTEKLMVRGAAEGLSLLSK